MAGIGLEARFNKTGNSVKTAAHSVFAAALTGVITKNIYDFWVSEASGSEAESYASFKEKLEKNHFTDDVEAVCQKFAADLIRHFYFREMLLLGKDHKNPNAENARKRFLEELGLVDKDKKTQNATIEAYFLEELNELFNESFKQIQQAQEARLAELSEDSIWGGLRRLWSRISSSEEERANFTQNMKLQFLHSSRSYLLDEKNELTWSAEHYIISGFLTFTGGAIVGAIAMGIAAATVTALSGGLIWPAALLLGALCLGLKMLFERYDRWRYKRAEENRDSIQETADAIADEMNDLQKQILHRKPYNETTREELEGFLKKGTLVGFRDEDSKLAFGSSTSWAREFAARIRQSEDIEVELKKRIELTMKYAREQNGRIIKSLNNAMQHKDYQPQVELPIGWRKGKDLVDFIKTSMAYLKGEDNAATIREFELIEKIRQQVLEIVSDPSVRKDVALPQQLVTWFCLPVAEGGLGGTKEQLNYARKLVNHQVKDSHTAEEIRQMSEDYRWLVNSTDELKTRQARFVNGLSRRGTVHFLWGDKTYRDMLGLPKKDPTETQQALGIKDSLQVNADNIDEMLENSYGFLMSLTKTQLVKYKVDGEEQEKVKMDKYGNPEIELSFSNEFYLYRMMLLKQLASIWDPNNTHIRPDVQVKIRNFVKDRLGLDAELIFDDILSQKRFLHAHREDTDGQQHMIFPSIRDPYNLQNVMNALRVDAAYSRTTITPRHLLQSELSEFMAERATLGIFKRAIIALQHRFNKSSPSPEDVIASRTKGVFAMGDMSEVLKVDATAAFVQDIATYVDNTEAFMKCLQRKHFLHGNGTYEQYKKQVSYQVYKEMIEIHLEITDLAEELKEASQPQRDEIRQQLDYLIKAYRSLYKFSQNPVNCFPLSDEKGHLIGELGQMIAKYGHSLDSFLNEFKYWGGYSVYNALNIRVDAGLAQVNLFQRKMSFDAFDVHMDTSGRALELGQDKASHFYRTPGRLKKPESAARSHASFFSTFSGRQHGKEHRPQVPSQFAVFRHS